MNQFQSSLGFDVSDVLKSLKLMDTAFTLYNKNLKDALSATGAFNNGQDGFAKTVLGMADAAEKTVKSLKDLAVAEKKVADARAAKSSAKKAVQDLKDQERAAKALAALKQRIGGVDRTAPMKATDLVNFDKAVAQFQKLIQSSKATSATVKKVLQNLQGNYTGTAQQVQQAIVKIIAAQNKLGGANTSKLQANLAAVGITGFNATKQITTGTLAANKAAQAFTLTWQSVSRLFAAQVIYRGISAFTNQLEHSVRRAAELQIKLAQIQTIAPPDLAGSSLDQVGTLTRGLSERFGIDELDAASALYEAFSNQIGNTSDAMLLLDSTARLAKATVSDFGETSSVVAGVLNAYGLNASNAAEVSNILFKTIDVSAAKMGEFEGALGRVLPTMTAAGVTFTEFNQAFSALSIQGTNTDTALTQLLNTVKGLTKPTDALKERFRQMGVASAEAGIAQFGLINFLKEISSNANSVSELSRYFDDIREILPVVALNSEAGAKALARSAEIYADASRNINAAFQLIEATPAQSLQKNIEIFKNILTREAGNAILKSLQNITKAMGGTESASRTLASATRIIAKVFDAFAFAAGAAVLALDKLLGKWADTTASEKFNEGLRKQREAITETSQKYLEAQTQIDKATKQGFSDSTKEAISQLTERNRATEGVRRTAESLEQLITTSLSEQLGKRKNLINQFLGQVEQSVDDSKKEIDRISQSLQSFQLKANNIAFDRNLQTAREQDSATGGNNRESQIIDSRIKELQKAAAQAAQSGDAKAAENFLNTALDLTSQLISLKGKERQGDAARVAVLKQGETFYNSQIKAAQNMAAANDKSLPSLKAQAQAFDTLLERFNNLKAEMLKGGLTGDAREQTEKDLKEVGTALQKIATDFAKNAPKGIADDLLKKIPEGLQDLTGARLPIDLQIEDSLSQIRAELDRTRFTAKVELQIEKLTGIAPGPDQINQAQTKLAQNRTSFDRDLDNSKNISDLSNQIAQARDRLASAFQQLAADAKLPEMDVAGASAEQLRKLEVTKNFWTQQVAEIKASFDQAVNTAILNPGDGEALKGVADSIAKIDSILAGSNDANYLKDFNVTLGEVKAELATIGTVLPQLNESIKLRDGTAEATVNLGTLNGLLDTAKTRMEAGKSASDAITASYNSQAAAANANADAQLRLADALAKVAAAGSGGGGGSAPKNPVGQARGGLMHFFESGGFAPRGTDTVPAMLSPGEFVVNAAATRRFYSELVAINSGRGPTYRQDGGNVTNQFGDININNSGGGESIVVDKLVREINRRTRRGSSKLRR